MAGVACCSSDYFSNRIDPIYLCLLMAGKLFSLSMLNDAATSVSVSVFLQIPNRVLNI